MLRHAPSNLGLQRARNPWRVRGRPNPKSVCQPAKPVEIEEPMNTTEPFIPPRTRAELASPASQGHRHEQMKRLVLPLLGAGLTPQAVFIQLRETYERRRKRPRDP